MRYIIIGNFGNHSLAVMQALIVKKLAEVHFIYVETGWADNSWSERVLRCGEYARRQNVKVHLLKAKASFSEMVVDRKQFPSRKFQWCASFLKGLTILEYLDEIDPFCEAQIVLGKRQQDSRRYIDLSEFDHESELYQGRTIWHPLWQTNNQDFTQLIRSAGFSLLPHPSLECSPCIHSNLNTLKNLDSFSAKRLEQVEQAIGQSMFHEPINYLCTKKEKPQLNEGLTLNQFDFGCGSAWGCGE